MSQISVEDLKKLDKLISHNPHAALATLREYELLFAGDPNLETNRGGFYIDIGADLQDVELIEHGVELIESILGSSKEELSATLLYNLGNGYSELNNLQRRPAGYEFDPDNTPLLKAKYFYRQAIHKETLSDRNLKAQLWVNYGNCLSGLGRAAEAIQAYDHALRLQPGHPMAHGNLGIELHHFASISQNPIFLLDALEHLDEALAHRHLGKFASRAARGHFERVKQKITDALKGLGLEHPNGEKSDAPRGSEDAPDYVAFSAKHDLFLNFCLRCRRCPDYAKDSFTISLTTKLDDTTTFIRLSRVVNEIKERYAFARFLLFQALHPLVDTIKLDRITTYIDNLDYAIYGTRSASLKMAFECAYGIFDKIAYFLKDYLSLDIDSEAKVNFTTNGLVWREKNNPGLRANLRDLQNWHLFGLYDIARDLSLNQTEDGYFGYLRRTRNRLAHEYVIPHVEGIGWEEQADKADCHLYYHQLIRYTFDLLQLTRAAIIYLIAFIMQEEQKKRASINGIIGTLPMTFYDPDLFGSAID